MDFIDKLNNSEFEKVYNIMEESFPLEEYRTKENQKKLLENEDYNIAVYRNENNKIIGFIAYYDFKRYIHIDHFAVAKNERGKGIGRKFFKEFKKYIDKKITLEVELPKDNTSRRRIIFYKTMGLKLYNYKYFQPPMRNGFGKTPLMIMSDIDGFTLEKFQIVKRQIYTHVYNFFG